MQKLPTSLLPFFFHFIKKQPVAFTAFFLSPLVLILETTIIPYAMKMIIDGMTTHEQSRIDIFADIKFPLWLLGSAWLLQVIFLRLQNWWQAYVIPRFEADIRMSVMEYVTYHSHRYFSEHLSGKLANKINDLPRAIESIRMIMCWNVISSISIISASLVIVASIGKVFVIIFLVWIISHLVVTASTASYVNSVAKENAENKSELSGTIVDVLSNMISVKLFANREYDLSYCKVVQNKELESNKTLIIRMNLFRLLMDTPVTIMLGVMVYFLITYWQTSRINTGDFVFIINVTFGIMYQMWHLGHVMAELFSDVGVARQALSLINVPHQIVDAEGAEELKVDNGEIEYKNVSFHYKLGDNIFENRTIKIDAGSRVGLVGFSGSGKTTFVNLMLRFFEIDAGEILIDGQNIAKVTQDSLRRNISVIPQDTSLFHRSIMENIRYGRVDATDEEVIDASIRAHCHEFIKDLPEGYDALVGERGIKLSGGQRQRIAIARAILKDAPILILDEATSALDSVTEKQIQDSLRRLMKARTTIVIAHRLSTLAEMDRILVFGKGHVIEDGTHTQLMKLNGHYTRMWQMQAGGFLPDKDGRQ